MVVDFEFVSTDTRGRPASEDRALIRRHCMRGKNKQENSRRSLREAKKATAQSALALHKTSSANETSISATKAAEADYVRSCLVPEPRPGLSDLGSVRFAEELDGRSRELLRKYFHAMNGKHEPAISCIDFGSLPDDGYLRWLCSDATFLQAILLLVSAVSDFSLRRRPGRSTYFHLKRTISALNHRLSDTDSHMINSNIYVILVLVLTAGLLGDHQAATAHLSGLQKIVGLRGGILRLQTNASLHWKLEQLDLWWSLHTGARPHFHPSTLSWDPIFAASEAPGGTAPSLEAILNPRNETKLMAVFQDLHHVVSLVNSYFGTTARIEMSVFQESMSSIQLRLLLLRDTAGEVTAECLRLGLLTFLTTTVQVYNRTVPYGDLATRLRTSCRAMEPSTPELRVFLSWLLLMGVISVFDPDEPWLLDSWERAAGPGLSWDELRSQLRGILWVDCIHDKLGAIAFGEITDRLSRRERGERTVS